MQLRPWTLAIVAAVAAMPSAAQQPPPEDLTQGLSDHSPSAELFLRAYRVFAHPRCSNCHPADDRPRWGEAGDIHGMNVQRNDGSTPGHSEREDKGNYGRIGMTCMTCHQTTNGTARHSPPGAENWRLAPKDMGWGGLPAAELCAKLTEHGVDKAIEHIVGTLDPLVKWAWHPGLGRNAVPGKPDQFITIMNWWNGSGAGCPS